MSSGAYSDTGTSYTPGIGQTAGGTSLYTNVDALGSVHDTQTNGSDTQNARKT